jgi:hypothetical protein
MDFFEFIVAAVVILAIFEAFASRRHSEMIKTLNLVNDTLNTIQDQTDTRRPEKLKKTKELLRQEFAPVAEFIDDKLTKRAFVFTKAVARTQLDFIRDYAGPDKSAKEKQRTLDERVRLEAGMAKTLADGAPEQIAAYIQSLPSDELRGKFNTIMSEVHSDIL